MYVNKQLMRWELEVAIKNWGKKEKKKSREKRELHEENMKG